MLQSIIQSLDDEFGDITVQALRLKNEDGTDFIVQPEDAFNVTTDCIDQILPDPQVLWKNRALTYKFKDPVGVFEKM